MDTPTRNLSLYVKEKGINLAKMARDTGIPYMALYSSLLDDKRNRTLKAGELVDICKFIGKNPMDFAEESQKCGK